MAQQRQGGYRGGGNRGQGGNQPPQHPRNRKEAE